MDSSLSFSGKSRLLFLDLVVLLSCLAGGFYFRLQTINSDFYASPGLWFIIFTNISCLYLVGSYDVESRLSFRNIFIRLTAGLVLSLMFIILINYLLAKDRAGIFGRGTLFLSLILFLAISVGARFQIWKYLRKAGEGIVWLFLTDAQCLATLRTDLEKYKFAGRSHFLLSDEDGKSGDGSWSEFKALLSKRWSGIVLATPSHKLEEKISQELMLARFGGHQVLDLTDFYERVWQKVPVYYLGHEWFVLSEGFRLLNNPLRLRLKRLTDLLLSTVLLLLLWPLLLVTALAIRLESSGAVLYKQIRTGKDGRNFKIYKFRSMRQDAEKAGARWASKNDSRVTRIGKWIRLTRIDELPQLWNVFRGDMSFIGPRPERPEFNVDLEKVIPFYHLRHLVRPGITGWAQVKYPYGASVEDAKEKLQFDLFYIKNYDLFLDFQIIMKTVRIVFFAKGR